MKQLAKYLPLQLTDKFLVVYILFSIIWIMLGQTHIPNFKTLILEFCGLFAAMLGVIALHNHKKHPIINFLRFWYPVIFLEFFFKASTEVDLVIFNQYLDPFFQHIDFLIFGHQPASIWGAIYDTFLMQEFFHAAYYSYYLMIFGVPLYVYLKKDQAEFDRTLFNIIFVFIACYIVYIILPVTGGRSLPHLKELTETYRHGPFTRIMAFIYTNSSHNGGAFPSSHVAIALTISLLSFRYGKTLGKLLLVNTFFLSISTVFCHYHYFIDVIGGLLYGTLMFLLSDFIFKKYQKSNY